MTITPKYNKHQGFLADLVTCALEGGISYWAIADEYKWCGVNRDGTGWFSKEDQLANLDEDGTANAWALVMDSEEYHELASQGKEDDMHWLRVDKTTIKKGIETMIRIKWFEVTYDEKQGWIQDHTRLWNAILSDGDDGDYDANDADSIVQFGLFGKLIYG